MCDRAKTHPVQVGLEGSKWAIKQNVTSLGPFFLPEIHFLPAVPADVSSVITVLDVNEMEQH
jgi:hypothetical protein